MFWRSRRVAQEDLEEELVEESADYQCVLCGQEGDVAVEAVTREEFRCDHCLLETDILNVVTT